MNEFEQLIIIQNTLHRLREAKKQYIDEWNYTLIHNTLRFYTDDLYDLNDIK